MNKTIVNTLNSILATPNPELRASIVSLLEQEIERAKNDAFCKPAVARPSAAYWDAYYVAKKQLKLAQSRNWIDHETLELRRHWLTLLGYRLCWEDGLGLGGLTAARIRAAERLNRSPNETREWGIDVLFESYLNTELRFEWNYEGTHFRSVEKPMWD